jgi:two-component system chemotaxis sensor kinase CheA
LDLAKYRALFLEEATDHLAEMSRALLCLEKDPGDGEAIDLAFRMAHSIKGMAGSLGYDAITEFSHVLEDRMSTWREAGRVPVPEGIALMFNGLEGLERMVTVVRETGEPPPSDAAALAALADPSSEAALSAEAAPSEEAAGESAGLKRKL